MIKQKQLNQIKEILDIIESFDDSYWIDKESLKQLYEILSLIDNEETFKDAYRATLANLNLIIEKIKRYDKSIIKLVTNRAEIVEKIEKTHIKVDLSAMNK